jgi:hypothetical protein
VPPGKKFIIIIFGLVRFDSDGGKERKINEDIIIIVLLLSLMMMMYVNCYDAVGRIISIEIVKLIIDVDTGEFVGGN